jgi:hypothetical protein
MSEHHGDHAVGLWLDEPRRQFRNHVRQAVRWLWIDMSGDLKRKVEFKRAIADPDSIHYLEPDYRAAFEAAIAQQWLFDRIDKVTGISQRESWDWQGA